MDGFLWRWEEDGRMLREMGILSSSKGDAMLNTSWVFWALHPTVWPLEHGQHHPYYGEASPGAGAGRCCQLVPTTHPKPLAICHSMEEISSLFIPSKSLFIGRAARSWMPLTSALSSQCCHMPWWEVLLRDHGLCYRSMVGNWE